MLTLLSPAKTLNFDFDSDGLKLSAPRFEGDIAELLGTCRKLTAPKLRDLMRLSPKLAELNRDRFRTMELPFTESNSKPALLTFGGDVYRGFDAASLSRRDLNWSQRRIRILSGFYGMLRPLDMMQPYRLEMGTRLSNKRGKNLYEFWGPRITEAINDDLKGRGTKAVVNLASNEYFKGVQPAGLKAPLVTALFKEDREGTIRTISFSAKRARGLMARFIVQNRVDSPEGMQDFNEEGYSYRPDLSDESTMLFVRDQHWKS
ncbi:MAG: peroxide stress protein YaaA [Acidobacteria bacterium]|nr:peroxide stress protein YaaA [Acidobacteriota bacterium]